MRQYRIVEKYEDFEKRYYPEYKDGIWPWRTLKAHGDQIGANSYRKYEDAYDHIMKLMPKVLFHCIEHPRDGESDVKIYHIHNK